MKLRTLVGVALALALALTVSASAGQSLGEIARQLREQKGKEGRQPVREYTNDNLPRSVPSEQPVVGPTAPEKPAEAASEPQEAAEAVSEQQPSGPTPAETQRGEAEPRLVPAADKKTDDKMKTKEHWQSRFAAIRSQLSSATADIRLLEDEISLLQIQKLREIGPNWGDASRPDLEAKIAAKKADLDSKQAAAEKARQALEALQKEFSESGAPEEWSKTQ